MIMLENRDVDFKYALSMKSICRQQVEIIKVN